MSTMHKPKCEEVIGKYQDLLSRSGSKPQTNGQKLAELFRLGILSIEELGNLFETM